MLPPFFLYTLAFGGIVVPRLNLILSLICHEYFADQSMKEPRFHFMPVILGNDNPQCQIPEVQSLVAKFTLYGNLIAGLLSAITSPKIGSLSDRYGRKRLIAFSISGMLAGEIITIIAATMPEMFSVQWLFVGYVFEGLCGSFTASMALTYAYASDCTPPVERNVVFGWLHGCLFGGIAIGPLMAGYIVKVSGKILTVFYLSLACHCVYLLFIILVVPESLTEERQLAAREKKAQMEEAEVSMLQSWPRNWLSILKGSNVFAPLMILYPKGQGSTQAVRRNLVLLAAVDTITFGVAMGSITVMLIYAEFVFGWGTFETSIFVSVVNTSRVAVLLLLLPLISRLFRSGAPRGSITASRQQQSGSTMFDISLIRVSVLFDLLGYIGFASVRTRPLFILSGVVASIGGMGSPTLSAALTKHVPQDRTGQMLGAMGLLHALARVVAPTVFNLIYSLTVGTYPQIVFICLGSMFGVAFLLSWGIRPNGIYPLPHLLSSVSIHFVTNHGF